MRTPGMRRPGGLLALYAALLAAFCAGCTTSPGSFVAHLTDEGRLLDEGPSGRLTASAIASARADSVPLLYAFALEAGQIPAPAVAGTAFPATDPGQQQIALIQNRIDWSAVTLVGEGYVDTQCGHFVAALDQLERSKRGTLANLNALQSAAVGIMGLALAAQKAIGIVGIAFGLTASLIDNSTSIVLYQLPASSVRAIVAAQRDTLRQAESGPDSVILKVTNQGLASARIAEYVQYCTPVVIEGNVGKVLGNATTTPDGRIVALPTIPNVSSALAPVISAIPANTPVVRIQPQNQRRIALMDLPVQQRKVALANFVRGVSDLSLLRRAADALNVNVTDNPPVQQLQARIIVDINNRVSDVGPNGVQQMNAVSSLVGPVFGRAF